MPVFSFRCDSCGAQARRLLPAAPDEYLCVCGKPMERNGAGPTSRATEVLDNGMMSRPLERLDNAEEIFRDRARADPRDME